jgi:hypothetical protein
MEGGREGGREAMTTGERGTQGAWDACASSLAFYPDRIMTSERPCTSHQAKGT